MLFVSRWSYAPEKREAVQARFKETGGKPPAGIKMLGRWHAIGGGKGVLISESDDPMAIAKWIHEWSDLLTFDIYPALNDEDQVKRIG